MPKGDKDKSIRCSFCGKGQEEVERIIAGPGVYICCLLYTSPSPRDTR